MLHTNEKIIKNKVGLLNLAEELEDALENLLAISKEVLTRT